MNVLKARGVLVTAAVAATVAAQVLAPSPVALAEPAVSPGSTAPAGATTVQPSTSRSVSFVGAAHSSPGAARFKAVTVPTAARAADRALLVFTHAARVNWAGPSGITGWRQVASTTANGLVSTVYSKPLAAGDLHHAVRFGTSRYAKAILTVAVYSRVTGGDALTAVAGSDRGTTRHVTPAVTASPGDRVISYWADHRSSTTSWTSSDATTRDAAIGTGGGRYGALLADTTAPSSGGAVPGRVGVTNAATNAVTWTVRLPTRIQPPPPPPPPPTATTVTKLLVIVEENETTKAYAKMPYLKRLSNTYGKATSYTGLVHPSLGNYLAMVSGQGTGACGLGDPLPARCPQSGPTVFGRALRAGKTARTYAEAMSTPCQTTNSTGYAGRHNPWVYFTYERAGCVAHSAALGPRPPVRCSLTSPPAPCRTPG